jgi:hypothetical protein
MGVKLSLMVDKIQAGIKLFPSKPHALFIGIQICVKI